MKARPLVCLLVSLTTLAGCKTLPLHQQPPTLMPLAEFPAAAPAAVSFQRATPVPPVTPSPDAPRLPTPLPTLIALPYPAVEPGMRAADADLLFAAPIPSAAEILEWRPPPVPVPHSLHPNDHYWLRRPIPSGRVDWGLDWYPYGGNGGGRWRVHHGMDFPNDPGTPVLAAGNGVVVWVEGGWAPSFFEVEVTVEPDPEAPPIGGDGPEIYPTSEYTTTRRLVRPYGNVVIIQHDWGWQGEPVYTLYGHLLEIFVSEGEHVAAGDLVGGVGNTGDSTGPHLHFEVRVGRNSYGATRNPALWIAPYEGWGTLAGRLTTSRGTPIHNAVIAVYPMDAAGNFNSDDAETRYLSTYATTQLNPDDYWNENFVVPDLPAGEYQVVAWAAGKTLYATATIYPGVTSYVRLFTGVPATPSPTPTATLIP